MAEKIKVEFWDKISIFKCDSEVKRVEYWDNNEQSFIDFYNKNNQLKYCNGRYYKFADPKVNEKYLEFFKKWHTIENYYRGGVVD